jgi:UDP-N-acetyl-D-glucosamine dehydrogenase
LGGHCIPIDPFYLTWKAREYGQHTRFIELAGEINTAMPAHVVNRTAEALNALRKPMNGSRVLIVGLAYKPNVDDDRESPSYVLMDLLKARGAEVAYHDPYVPVIRPTREHPHWAGTRSVAGTARPCRVSMRSSLPPTIRRSITRNWPIGRPASLTRETPWPA